MRIEQLEYLAEIAKTHSISLAAENLFVTQPTISDAMKKLEHELDAPLFTRSKNGVQLTETGLAILPQAEAALQAVGNIRRIIADFKDAEAHALAGDLQIYAASAISINILPKTLSAFYGQYPKVNLTILEKNGRDMYQERDSDCDLKLFNATDEEIAALPVEAGQNLLALWTDRFYAFVNKESEAAKQKSLTLKEVCQYPLSVLAYYNHDNSLAESIFGANLVPNIVFRSSNREHIFRSVSLGHSVYVGLSISERENALPDNVTAVPINDSRKLRAYALYDTASAKLPLIEAFLQLLKDSH